MSKSKPVSKTEMPSGGSTTAANGASNDNLPGIDFEALIAETPVVVPKLSVLHDYSLDELQAGPDAEAIVEPDYDTIIVEKPNKMDFVFVHPAWRVQVFLLLPEGKRRTYTHAVLPGVARRFPQVCRKVQLVPYADKENSLYLWPVLLEDASGKLNEYSESARDRIRQGAGKWCRYEADLNRQRYRLYTAAEQIDPPQWPAGGMQHMVQVAFRDSVIATTDHEILRQRMGQAV